MSATDTTRTQSDATRKLVTISVCMPADLVKRLDERAAKERRSKSQMASILLEEALAATEPGKAVAP